MELPDIWEEEEETIPTPRLTWASVTSTKSFGVERRTTSTFWWQDLSQHLFCPPDFCPPDNTVCIEDDSSHHWHQEPDLEQQFCHLASHHHILHKKWTHDDGND
jgi:hypothetical protein